MQKNINNIQSLMIDDVSGALDPVYKKALDHCRCLVLNADFTPISILPPSVQGWEEVLKSVWQGNVTPIEEYENAFIRAPSMTLKVPSIVVSSKYVYCERNVQFSKSNLCIRDNYTCQYCDIRVTMQHLTQDHVIPRSAGGKTTWENIVMACVKCNGEKRDRLDYKKPKRMPVKPEYKELAAFARRQPLIIPDARWAVYLNWKGPLTVSDPFTKKHFNVTADGTEIPQDEIGM